MKPSKQIPRRLTINVLISIVGLGLIALGIVTATALHARPRVCPPNSVLVAGRYTPSSRTNANQRVSLAVPAGHELSTETAALAAAIQY
jgi:hypothetical protein